MEANMARVGITKAREKRWAIIGEDGRHVWMGRNSDPSEDEIVVAEQTLDAKGLAGWLAIVEGDYWSKRGTTGFIMVRPLAAPSQGKGVEGSTRPISVLRRLGLVRGPALRPGPVLVAGGEIVAFVATRAGGNGGGADVAWQPCPRPGGQAGGELGRR